MPKKKLIFHKRFLWIMGVCIPMSMKSFQKRKVPKGVALIGILRRSLVLFLLGFFWNTIGILKKILITILKVLYLYSLRKTIFANINYLLTYYILLASNNFRKKCNRLLKYFVALSLQKYSGCLVY